MLVLLLGTRVPLATHADTPWGNGGPARVQLTFLRDARCRFGEGEMFHEQQKISARIAYGRLRTESTR